MAPEGYSEFETYLFQRWVDGSRRAGYEGAITALRSCVYGAVEFLGGLSEPSRAQLTRYLFSEIDPSGALAARVLAGLDSPGGTSQALPGPANVRYPVVGSAEFLNRLGSALAAWRLNTFEVSPVARNDIRVLSAYSRSLRDGLAAATTAQDQAFQLAIAGLDTLGTRTVVQTQVRR